MSDPSTHSDFGILQQIFADIANDKGRDPIQHLLVLTYEFDDQQLMNLLSGRRLMDNFELQRNQLKFIADMQPVVIYDARKTREFNQLPHFLDLLPVNPGAYRCHHAKAYLFVTRKTVRLVLGSFNLTHTGLFENREVFMDFLWNDNEAEDLPILRDFIQLLGEGYQQWAQPDAASARQTIVAELNQRLLRWQNQNQGRAITSKHHLLTSGYALLAEPKGLSQLAPLWRELSNEPPETIFAVSPFFDQGKSCFADSLTAEVGVPRQWHLVTDETSIGKLGRRHFGAANAQQVRQLSLIPPLITGNERARITHANDGASLDGIEVKRALHAKILILCSGSKHLVYIGSANFTIKAWEGDNQELGIVSVEDGSAKHVIERILEALGAAPGNAYAQLHEHAIESEALDDEDYIEQEGYPKFLSGIRLREDDGGAGLAFEFLGNELHGLQQCLQKYDIHWGRIKLEIEGSQSRPIPPEKAYMPLQGGRNLRFVVRNQPVFFYLLPFVHDAALVRQQDLLLFPSPEDWLAYYLNPERAFGGGDGELIPGEGDQTEEIDTSVAADSRDREANIVIAMQRYLNLFSGVEKEFKSRAENIAATVYADDDARMRDCELRIVEPLRVYARLLEQDCMRKPSVAQREVYLFRLGELVLQCRALAATLPTVRCISALASTLANALAPAANSAAQLAYVKFIQEQLPHA